MSGKKNHTILRDSWRNGFTLVELLIAIAVSGVVMTALYTAYLGQQKSYTTQEQVAEMQQSIRTGMTMMAREIRLAGFDPKRKASAGITTATAGSLAFTYVTDSDGRDNDGDGAIDEANELTTATYQLCDAPPADGDLDLCRTDPSAAPVTQAIAENVDAIEFNYTLADGTQAIAPADSTKVRSVQISLVVRAGRNDQEFLNNQTYTSAAGTIMDLNGLAAGNGNPPGDKFRRRMLITTIQCRNMGL